MKKINGPTTETSATNVTPILKNDLDKAIEAQIVIATDAIHTASAEWKKLQAMKLER